MTRSVIRYATWRIAQDETAPPPSFVMRCLACGEHSEPDEAGGDAQQWALEHSGRNPSHTGYEGVYTSVWRTSMTGEAPAREPLIGRRDASPVVPESRQQPQ